MLSPFRALLLALAVSCVAGAISYDVSGPWHWTSLTDPSSPTVVSDSKYVHTALMNSGFIDDPLYRSGDVKYRWIAKSDWELLAAMPAISAEMKSAKRTELRVSGADTVATVKIDDQVVGHSVNQHRTYYFDITNIVQQMQLGQKSNVSLDIESAIKYADDQAAAYPYFVPPAGNSTETFQHGEGARQFIRKAGCDFAWDWGPCFAPTGLQGKISLLSYSSLSIREITFHTSRAQSVPSSVPLWEDNKQSFSSFVHVFVNAAREGVTGKLRVTLTRPPLSDPHYFHEKSSEKLFSAKNVNADAKPRPAPPAPLVIEKDVSLSVAGEQKIEVDFTVDEVALWWTKELGNQPLYKLDVEWISQEGETDKQTRTVGFKTIELIEDDIPSGATFYFKLNGRKVFLKGANLVPLHPFHDRAGPNLMQTLVEAVAFQHGNVMRVWGGGIYQDDLLYDLADEMGIFIWQEFMFACAMYPSNPEFLSEVKLEAQTVVRRLNSHVSLILWGGNNENEAALVQNWYDTKSKFDLFRNDYLALYIETLMPVVLEEDPLRVFLPSSPSNGKKEKKDGYTSDNPQSEFWGDVHYYNYDADCLNSSNLVVPRMASEYGLQSLPSLHSLSEQTSESLGDWNLFSDEMVHRQHHPLGNGQLETQIEKYLPKPKVNGTKTDVERFGHVVYLSQIAQSMCIKFETEHYRRAMSTLDSQGRGYTMGALYWQLNDVWAAPSWAGLEINSRFKILHHSLQTPFSKFLISPVLKDVEGGGGAQRVEVWAVSDLQEDKKPVAVRIEQWSMKQGKLSETTVSSLVLPPVSSSLVFSKDPAEYLPANATDVVLKAVMYDQLQNVVLAENFYFVSAPKNAVPIPDPGLSVTINRLISTEEAVFINIQAKRLPAAFVWLEAFNKGHFSENGFFMTQEFKQVVFTPHSRLEKFDMNTFEQSLTIRSLFDAIEQ